MAGTVEYGDYFRYHKRTCDEFLEYIAKKFPADAQEMPNRDLLKALAIIWASVESNK